MMLVPVIGGIVLASVSELDFTWACLAAAGGANVAAAFRGQENKKAMGGDMNAAIGGGANAYAIGTIWSTILLIPTIFISGEYQKARRDWGSEWEAFCTRAGIKKRGVVGRVVGRLPRREGGGCLS
jgi:solute carrier family 35 protein E1